jgi:hypothetical protein
MKIRFATALLALALPLAAQEPIAAETEAMFYKAFYLEKGQRDFVGAMDLYQKFLDQAPAHKLAAEAAKQQFGLLRVTGKTKERDAFKAKYEALLGNLANAPAEPADGARPAGGAAEGGRPAGRPDQAARVAELEAQLAKAKEAGNADEVKRLEQEIARAKQGGRGPGGRGGIMGLMGKKVAEMSDEELTQLKDGIGQSSRMVDMMRERGQEEQADKLEKGLGDLKKALDANNKEDAQKAVDALRELMPQRRRGGGGEGGAGGAGGARPAGGGGGGGGR